jgi:hypothetical protein
MAYAQAGTPLTLGGQYATDGFDYGNVEFRLRTMSGGKAARSSLEAWGWTQGLAFCPMYALLLPSAIPILPRRN